MDLTPANLRALNTRFGKEFEFGVNTPQVFWSDIATRIPSTSSFNTYAWMETLPGFREWIGPRVFHNLTSRVYQVSNKDWEDSYQVPRNTIEDDTFGIYANHSRLLGRAAALLWDDLVFDKLQAGVSAVGYDGQYFFDTDHPVNLDNTGAGTYSNKLTYDLTAENLALVAQAMRAFKGSDGRSLDVTPDLLIVPPQLGAKAALAINGLTAVGGVQLPNPYITVLGGANGIRPLVINRLSNEPTIWYLISTSMLKPIILQVRKEPVFQARTEPTMDNVFHRKMFEYGSDARGNAGYGMPVTAIRVATA